MTNKLEISWELAELLYGDTVKCWGLGGNAASQLSLILANHSEEPLGVVEPTLAEHCKQCAEVVKTWPESKRDCLGKIAAPVVERQPIGWFTEDHLTDKSATTYDRATADRWIAKGWPVSPLYTSPPAPVAVALPTHQEMHVLMSKAARQADLTSGANYFTAAEFAAIALLDKVKELNQ